MVACVIALVKEFDMHYRIMNAAVASSYRSIFLGKQSTKREQFYNLDNSGQLWTPIFLRLFLGTFARFTVRNVRSHSKR